MNEAHIKCTYNSPCDRLASEIKRVDEQKKRLDEHDARLAESDNKFTSINTKLNFIIGIFSAIGVAVLGAAIKFLFGG